jgi:hypothetical protein
MTLEREPLSTIERLTLLPVIVAAICCVVAFTAWTVRSPERKSATVGAAAKTDALSVAHHRLHHQLRAFPMIGRRIKVEAQPAPQPASITPQKQPSTPPPKPDPAPQLSRTEPAKANDPVCGERGRHWFADRPRHRSWRCNR